MSGERAVASTGSKRARSTVTLSAPPAALAASTSAARGVLEGGRLGQRPADGLLRHEAREPVGAEQQDVPRGERLARAVDLHLGLGAERPGDHVALRVGLGVLGGQGAAAHHLAHQRVVVGQPPQLARRGTGRPGSRRRAAGPGVRRLPSARRSRWCPCRRGPGPPRPCAGSRSWPPRWRAAARPPRAGPARWASRSTATPAATSPACAPPMPSATAIRDDSAR